MAQRSEARVWGFAKSGYLCAHQKRNTHSLSPFRFEEKARAVGRKAQWDPANQLASQPASSVRTCLPTFRLPAVPRVGTFNLQPAALKNAARECGNARESLQTLLQHFVMECFVAEGGRDGGKEWGRREEKRREIQVQQRTLFFPLNNSSRSLQQLLLLHHCNKTNNKRQTSAAP